MHVGPGCPRAAILVRLFAPDIVARPAVSFPLVHPVPSSQGHRPPRRQATMTEPTRSADPCSVAGGAMFVRPGSVSFVARVESHGKAVLDVAFAGPRGLVTGFAAFF